MLQATRLHMQNQKMQMFFNRLSKVFKHVSKQARRQGVTCYRVYDHDLPEFPLCLELYEGRLYVAEYLRRHTLSEEEHEQWLQEAIDIACLVLQVDKSGVYVKLRQRKAGRQGQYQKYNEEQNEFEVKESGLRFLVNLTDYLDTGIFLDHRVTRQMVREEAQGKRVLNLFAYTGTFSVYAAAGGASVVHTVDMSKTYLAWAERNMLLNGFTHPQQRSFIHADVLQWLQQQQVKETYDLVVLDPPTFSNSKRMDDFFDVQQHHPALINNCLALMPAGGTLYFSTNYTKFVLGSADINAADIKDITRQTTPFDFEGKLKRFCFKITR